MKKIIFFSRCELVHLYGGLTQYLQNSFEIHHIAFSIEEKEILENKYNIFDVVCLKDEFEKIYDKQSLNQKVVDEIDQLIIKNSSGQFCLNSAIQSDRTYDFYSYTENLRLCQSYYLFWKEYLNRLQPNYFIHEPVALFMTQIVSYLITECNGQYLTNIQVIGDNKLNWIFVDGISGQLFIPSNHEMNKNSSERAALFVNQFKELESSVFFSHYNNNDLNVRRNRLYLIIRLLGAFLKMILKSLFKINKKNSKEPLSHIDDFITNFSPSILDQMRMKIDRYFYLEYDLIDLNREYYYYPIHMEPEATVLYWADGYYKNQVKLIENIAAQLPPNVFLYVKDHPHGIGNRSLIDYNRIKAISNVKLLNPQIPGIELIKSSIGVITINGTGGFEAYLLGKVVFTFGSNYYTRMHGVIRLIHIKNLREELYKSQISQVLSDLKYMESIGLFLSLCNNGFTDYFVDYAKKSNIDDANNIREVAKGFIKHLF
jgi:hypothetical protein